MRTRIKIVKHLKYLAIAASYNVMDAPDGLTDWSVYFPGPLFIFYLLHMNPIILNTISEIAASP